MKYIEESMRLKQDLDSLRPLKKEDELRIMQKFRLDWNYHSNNLEGNTLTYGETKALILFGITAQGKPLKDHFEITGHDEALKWLEEIITQKRPLTEKFIRELHKLILKESYEVRAITPEGEPTRKTVNVGVYKKSPNHVRTKTGEIFRFATPEETPAKMTDLVGWYHVQIEEKEINPILLAAQFHYKYIRIHPFDDGNGRTARILMNFILMQFGYPPVIIKTEDKENYFAALRLADVGELEPFIKYIAENLNHSLEIMIKGAKGESIEEPDDLDKEIALLAEKLKTVGNPVSLSKNQETTSEIYFDSIVKLIEKFNEKSTLFNGFYLKHKSSFYFNNKERNGIMKDQLQRGKMRIKGEIESIRVTNNYQGLNQVGLDDFNFKTAIKVEFSLSNYKVTTSDRSFKKPYGVQLTETEINELVNSESKRHKAAIEAEIEKVKNGK